MSRMRIVVGLGMAGVAAGTGCVADDGTETDAAGGWGA